MIIYTVRIPIDKNVEVEWFEWMSLIHIPEVIRTGHFLDYTFMKLISEEQPGERFTTYEIQYVLLSKQNLDLYLTNDAEGIRYKHLEKFKDYLDIPNITRSEYADMTEFGHRIMETAAQS